MNASLVPGTELVAGNAGQEATVRTGYETTDWFQIGEGVCQGCILILIFLLAILIPACASSSPAFKGKKIGH